MSETNGGFAEAIDTTVAPTTEAPAEPQVTTTEPAEPDASAPAGEPKATPAEPAPKRKPWYENVIGEARSVVREVKRENAELRERLATAAKPAAQPQVLPATEVERRANEIANDREFVNTCNEIAEAAEAKYQDFDTAVRNFAMLGDMPKPFLEAITALGKDDGARVYYDLGKDPDEAARVFKLPPVKMALELAKRAAPQPKVVAVSKAPAPIEPITSRVSRGDAEPDVTKNPEQWREWFREHQHKR